MPTVIGVHELELKPGVSAEEFEQFAREFVPAYSELPGTTVTFYSGERGARAGRYLLVFTFESAAARDRMFPTSGQPSEEMQHWSTKYAAMSQRWEELVTGLGGPTFTDYAEVAG